jgi:hypothetical protein
MQGLQIDGSTLMMPIAQEHAGFTTVGPGCGYEPIYKITTVLIVQQTVRLESKVYVSTNCYLAKKICH